MRYHYTKPLLLLLGIAICCLGFGCSNSESNGTMGYTDSIAETDSAITQIIPQNGNNLIPSKIINYLPLNDSVYPYAGIPRIVIETEDNQAIVDRETEIPAKLQVWGKNEPESEPMNLTIRGRGNTSWTDMPKKSYKIEFVQKQSLLGMPKDRDWALIANYADKTLMKNYLAYHLSAELGAFYAPRCDFVELYLNKEYLGVYLLTETIKISKKRIKLPQTENSFVVEVDGKYRPDEQVVFSKVLHQSTTGKAFQVHEPHNASEQALADIESHIQAFETQLKKGTETLGEWLDFDESVKYYWIQELAKNLDAGFNTSIYFSYQKGGKIKMGPVWDFDLAFGRHTEDTVYVPQNWYIREHFWHKIFFSDSLYNKTAIEFWEKNLPVFKAQLDTIDSVGKRIGKAAQNNFKRWRRLENSIFYTQRAYSSYGEALEDLKNWLNLRIEWISQNIY